MVGCGLTSFALTLTRGPVHNAQRAIAEELGRLLLVSPSLSKLALEAGLGMFLINTIDSSFHLLPHLSDLDFGHTIVDHWQMMAVEKGLNRSGARLRSLSLELQTLANGAGEALGELLRSSAGELTSLRLTCHCRSRDGIDAEVEGVAAVLPGLALAAPRLRLLSLRAGSDAGDRVCEALAGALAEALGRCCQLEHLLLGFELNVERFACAGMRSHDSSESADVMATPYAAPTQPRWAAEARTA